MARFVATLRTPAAIAGTVAGPYVRQMLEHPSDGTVLDQETAREEGSVRIEFEADDVADAEPVRRASPTWRAEGPLPTVQVWIPVRSTPRAHRPSRRPPPRRGRVRRPRRRRAARRACRGGR